MPEENELPLSESPESAPLDPLILVPLSSNEFERRRRRVRIATFIILAMAAGLAGFAYMRYTAPMRAREAFDSGERLLRTARYQQAILSFGRAISLRGDYGEAYLLRGQAQAAISDLDNALADFAKAIELLPNNPQPYIEHARASIERKKFEAALRDCEKAIGLQPEASIGHNLRGVVLREQGEGLLALQEFNLALGVEENLDNLMQRGATYQLLDRHKEAVADFDRAIHFYPNSAQPYFARAASRRALGDNKGADADHLQGRILDGR